MKRLSFGESRRRLAVVKYSVVRGFSLVPGSRECTTLKGRTTKTKRPLSLRAPSLSVILREHFDFAQCKLRDRRICGTQDRFRCGNLGGILMEIASSLALLAMTEGGVIARYQGCRSNLSLCYRLNWVYN